MLKSSENTYRSIFICRLYPVKEACPKRKHKKRYKEKKPGRFVFGKTSFVVLFTLVWNLLCLIPWVFRFEIFTRHNLLCVFKCGQDLSLKLVPKDLL